MESKIEVKNLIDTMANAIENFGENVGLENVGKVVKYELAQFMMYLSASDGEIKWDEASMISDLCDLSLTPQTMSEFIRENNIYSIEFEQKAPITLQMMVTADNELHKQNLIDETTDIPSMIVETYKIVANMLMESDGDFDLSEKNDYQIYIDMMNNYIKENSNRRNFSVSGFTKNVGNVSSPAKAGVSAPKKKE